MEPANMDEDPDPLKRAPNAPRASIPSPEISFDFVTSDVGANWRDSSPEAPSNAASLEIDADDPAKRRGAVVADNTPPEPRFQVAIPELPIDCRDEYDTVYSQVVERVNEAVGSRRQTSYNVDFTDGRQELVLIQQLRSLHNGREALDRFISSMNTARKRKHVLDDEWDSEAEASASDVMEIDDEDASPLRPRMHGGRALRSRGPTTRQGSSARSLALGDDSSDDAVQGTPPAHARNLRARPSKQMQPRSGHSVSLKSSFAEERDELAGKPQEPSDEGEDGTFRPIVSDLATKKIRRPGALRRLRRMDGRAARSKAQQSASRNRGSDYSDIEFEPPRRTSRATKNTTYTVDDAPMDDDSLYVVDDKTPSAPKTVLVRETFQPLSPDSAFGALHIPTCHTCGGSKQRGQIVCCQGCSLSFHKQCLGPRNAREHLATKIGDDSFVLQCRFCLDVYRKRSRRDVSANAPLQSLCQVCKTQGESCVPFSESKTARQEEKLREQNGGVDPITPVSPTLLNNEDALLFRCVSCHRGWHLDHLPAAGNNSIGTDVKQERIKDYMVDWQCNECSSSQQKIHRLVAWRPSQLLSQTSPSPSFDSVDEDDKEYLVKWESLSYFHCTWMPGAWVFGVSTASMTIAFAKHAAQQDLLKLSEKDAVPDEYLMADVIFNVKMEPGAPKPATKKGDVANIVHVGKVLVKFQGLAYDDVVWDEPPPRHETRYYSAYEDAYLEYLEGKYFRNESQGKMQDRIKSFKASDFEPVAAQPAGLRRGKLMGYQTEGLNWLLGNYHDGRSVVLADEMGLGKTIQVISLITSLVQDTPKCWPFFIVVPNATCPNWRREFKQWAPDVRVVTYHGGREPQELAYKYELFPHGSTDMRAHVVIMSYDSAQDPKTKTLFKSVRWTGLVVDEGQRLKNDQNLLYLALRSMKIPFRLLLTGTPLQNNKRELFNLLQFIDDTQDAAALDLEYQVLDKETLPKLLEKIRPFFLRRTKLGVLKFLPPMAQIILPVTMTVVQEKLSKSIMAKNPQLIKAIFANNKLQSKDRSSLNNIMMQLRKCLCHPFLYSDAIEERHHDPSVLHRNLVEASAKLLLLEAMLPKLKERGHRVLIFSQFLQQLDILEDFLTGMGYQFRRLDGTMSSLEKQRRIDGFNAPDSPFFAFLLSTRSGGVGINLATADTVIIMDPDFNPHQDIQALSRAHRIGQKKKVLCFQIVTKDSVEERIMQMGRKKMALDHALIESMDDDQLVGDDLESILRHGAQALFSEDFQKSSIHYDGPAVEELLDRAQTEQTKIDEEGSAETQFSHARVWANEKGGFSEGLDTAEDQAPEPINSSVWDKILAEREEEARREAEANKEVLGRGGRRRNVISYNPLGVGNAPLPEGIEPDTSDASDEFAGANSSEESEDEGLAAKDGEGQADLQTIGQPKQAEPTASTSKHPLTTGQPKQVGPTASTSKRGRSAKKTDQGLQAAAGGTARHPRENAWNHNAVKVQFRNGPVVPQENDGRTASRPPFSVMWSNGHAPQHGVFPHSGVPGYHDAHVGRGGQPHHLQAMNMPPGHVGNPQWLGPADSQSTGQPPRQFTDSLSEAQLRLAIDEVSRSRSNASTRQQSISTLLYQLRNLDTQNLPWVHPQQLPPQHAQQNFFGRPYEMPPKPSPQPQHPHQRPQRYQHPHQPPPQYQHPHQPPPQYQPPPQHQQRRQYQ